MKIWNKGFDNDARIDAFTVGRDRELDLMLAPFDIEGTIAHITMLSQVGLLSADDLAQLQPELRQLHQEALEGRFTISGEDVHSEVEARLTEKLGDVGKKVHTGRSRNDQVALDVKLFTRARIRATVEKVSRLFALLQQRSEELKDVLMLVRRLCREPLRRPSVPQGRLGRDGPQSAGIGRGIWFIGPAGPGKHHAAAGLQGSGL